MKAKLGRQMENGRNYSGDKEEVGSYQAVVIYKGEIVSPVTVRCWMSRSNNASVVYASIWAWRNHAPSFSTSGHGSAGGWGYHKESAAIDDAIKSAGITLYGSPYVGHGQVEDLKKQCRVDGVGDDAVRSAIVAIVRALGYRGKVKIV